MKCLLNVVSMFCCKDKLETILRKYTDAEYRRYSSKIEKNSLK